jgi:hypothetical protein
MDHLQSLLEDVLGRRTTKPAKCKAFGTECRGRWVRTKNAAAITKAEREHLAWVKSQPCGVCDAPGPSEAHHIEQGLHFSAIPLCPDCHRGSFNGLHGQRRIWAVMKKSELSVLDDTIRRMRSE